MRQRPSPWHARSLGQGEHNEEHTLNLIEVLTEGQMVFDMYPGYEGARPKMQIYHGSADSTLNQNNYNETIKQWCGVFGYDYTKPDATQANTPTSRYTTYTWGDKLVGVYAQGVGHSVPMRGSDDMKFFGL